MYVSIQKIYIYRVGRFDGVRRTERVQSTSETRTAYRTSVSEGVWTTFVHLYGFMVEVGFVQIDSYICLSLHDNFLHVCWSSRPIELRRTQADFRGKSRNRSKRRERYP